MSKHSILAAAFSCLSGVLIGIASSANASEVVLIGGGNDIHSSQAQIEFNVKWVQNILVEKNINVSTYFNDGNEPGVDVHYTRREDQTKSDLEPLARVFGDWILERRLYREHEVVAVAASTRKSDLEPALQAAIERTKDAELMLIYNGHGGPSHNTADEATLNLWDNTRLAASELHSLLKPRSAPVKYLFTQCYSGGFHRIAYAHSQSGLALNDNKRCGFTAESAYRMAEGCSASINTDDYRDYTTYFFAALSGFERDGQIIGKNPDTNDDGTTTLREAHLYTLEEAMSTDLSRSSSEDYLMQWQPWYLRWLPSQKNLPNNEYARLFRDLSTRHGIALNHTAAATIRTKQRESETTIEQLKQQMQSNATSIEALQFTLQSSLSNRWPALLGPYTGAYQTMVNNGELNTIVAAVSLSADYEKLVSLQTDNEQLSNQLLEMQRKATQYQKLIHLRQLALLQQQISEYGTQQEQADYASLVSCEDEPLM